MKTQRIFPKKKKQKYDINDAKKKWQRLREIIGFTPKLDGMISSMSGKIKLDIFALEKQIPNYNGKKCEYKGKSNYSMSKAIKKEWGKEAEQLIKELI